MAIGLGKMFGFEFLENFNYPYISKSITEFWRRWHMSLGSWFRDYVYIPLGGNRVGKGRWYVNILVVWALTGLWHGAAWNFVLWGLLFAVLLVVEKHWLLSKLNQAKVWNHFYVLFVVIIGFVLFNASSVKDAGMVIGGMFGFGGVPLRSPECSYYFRSYGVLLIGAMAGATPLPKRVIGNLQNTEIGKKAMPVLKPVWLLVLLAVCTAYLIDSSFNPFLYFRF